MLALSIRRVWLKPRFSRWATRLYSVTLQFAV